MNNDDDCSWRRDAIIHICAAAVIYFCAGFGIFLALARLVAGWEVVLSLISGVVLAIISFRWIDEASPWLEVKFDEWFD